MIKTLGEIGTFTRGTGFQKADLTTDGAPAIHYGQLHTHYGTWTQATKSYIDPALSARLRHARSGDLIIATTSEDDAAVAKATAWIGDGEVAVSGDAYIYRHTLEPKYASYYFQTKSFHAQKARHITGTKVRRISDSGLAKVLIPVPEIEVQREIASILDSFTDQRVQLDALLELELDARRGQYVFYRDRLLSFSATDVPRIALGSAGTFFGGLTGKSKADFAGGNARFITYRNVFENIAVDLTKEDFVRVDAGERQRTVQRGDVLFTGSSETPNEVGMSSVVTQDVDGPIYLNSFTIGYRLNRPHILDPQFAKHLFRSADLRRQIIGTASGVTRYNVSKKRLAMVEVSVPDLGDQGRIADLLDRYDQLVTNLSADLRAELSARRQQYNYYRDMLFTLPETEA